MSKIINKSVDEWKTSFATFARDALEEYKGGINDEYRRALVACEAILSEKETDNGFFIKDWKPYYGAVIMTSEVMQDPLTFKVYVIGLDEWAFTIDAAGNDNATCEGDPAFLLVGDVPKDKIDIFLEGVNQKLCLAESKKRNDRHASNQDGGIQRTPGFLRSKCIQVMCALEDNKIFENEDIPKITPQCSGFTDVGLHTGCNSRDTSLPLVQAVLKVTLKFGMNPDLTIPSHCYSRFMAEYYLSLAIMVKDKLHVENCSKEDINEAMHYLKVVSHFVSPLSNHNSWPGLLAVIAKKCQDIRKHLETVSSEQALLDSKRFVVPIPDLTVIEKTPSPKFLRKQEYETQDVKISWEKMVEDSKINLDWLPVENIKSLTDCEKLLEDDKFQKNDAYTFSFVFVSIEMFLLNLAKDHLKTSKKITNGLQQDQLVRVCNKYRERLQAFAEGGNTGGLLSTELYSHQVLISWLKFCLLFKLACDEISLLSKYSVPLNYSDLEHLVLKDKWAWELLDLISTFLQKHRNKGKVSIFSGRKDEINGMFTLADQFVAQYPEYDDKWVKESEASDMRIEKRWIEIQQKKKTCLEIRGNMSVLKQKIKDFTYKRNLHQKYNEETYFSGGRNQTRFMLNPEWNALNISMVSHENYLRDEERKLVEAQKAPEFLKQPLPVDEKLGKRALFFINMPTMLQYTWQASFEAQEMVFTDGSPMNPDGHNFHLFYKGPFPYRERKEVTETPLGLYIAGPPEHYGNENVEHIHDRNDGVWYPSGFSPLFQWRSNLNPFDAPRCTAVESFSEPVTDEGLKWTVIQQGSHTPEDRGNLALSKLHQKPLTMTREQFLSLGNLRAQPLLQLFHLLDSIKARSLPFDDKSIQTTHTVVRQALYHIGEIKELVVEKKLLKLWKLGIEPLDPSFMDTYRRTLLDALDRLKEASKNENELLIYIEIISFFAQFDATFNELIDECSAVAVGWAERMESEIQKARNESQSDMILKTQEKQHLFLLYALVSYEMILPESVREMGRINKIIELMLQISYSRPLQLRERAKNLIRRAYFFMARILVPFREHHLSFESVLTNAVKRVLPSFVNDTMTWKPLENSYCFWTSNKTGDYLSVNISNGCYLVNGSPPSFLPLDIRNHPLFNRVFGDSDFEVTVGKNGVRKALKPIIERYYSFLLVEDELSIYEEYEEEKLQLLENSASIPWCKDIPIGMIQLYSHWQSLDRNYVVFRPIHFRQRSIYYILKLDGLYKVPREDRELPIEAILHNSDFYDKYLLLDAKTKEEISVFGKFEESSYIHPYLTREKVFKVSLVRYRISFELKNDSNSYECSEFGEYKLRGEQQFSDMLYGFYEYLIMGTDSAGLTVIFPQGAVMTSDGKVLITRPTPDVIDEISQIAHSYNKFTMHPKFKSIQAIDVLSGLQLATIQAATSSFLPEKGTQLTGYEMAIQQIRKCWINRPLTVDEELMLKSLFSLNDLPSALIILAQQFVKSSLQLFFLHQTHSPKTDLNADSFLKAVNEYNLPLQYNLCARNYRLSLTAVEMRSSLGMSKPTRHVQDLQAQAYLETPRKTPDVYKKREADIANYEKDLCDFTVAVRRKNDGLYGESSLKNLPSFDHKEIGTRIVTELRNSHEQYSVIPNINLRIEKTLLVDKLAQMHDFIEKQKEEIVSLIKLHCKISDEAHAINIFQAANEIPILTMCDLVKASWQPDILKYFNPTLSEHDTNELSLMIIDWMQFCVLDDKIFRIKKKLQSNEIDLAVQELQVQRNYDPYHYPQWLAFEFDQGLQIRPDQVIIIHHILDNSGSVAQLNMGLGKTRVIVPCLLLEWSRRRHIPRVYFLSSLLDEGFDYLHQTLTGGIFTKKLFRFPFSRDVKLNIEQARILMASMKYCQIVEGAIILAPEHSLSLLLKGFELDQTAKTCEISKIICDADKFPFADIFDEVDEMMCPNQELIYAEGSPIALESGPRRWGAIFSLFYNLRYHPDLLVFFQNNKFADFESDIHFPKDEFNKLRLLPGKQLERQLKHLIQELAKSLFDEKTTHSAQNTLSWMNKLTCEKLKERIIVFITDTSESQNNIKQSDLLRPEYFQDLLALRGLLAYEVLIHCLKLRHAVDYGVVPNHKTLMAIPFRAANLPKLRSEFAQPDCAVAFTALSYYNIGLTRDQVIETFSKLLSTGPTFQRRVYDAFYELCKVSSNKQNTEDLLRINTIDKLDLANEVQVDFLYRMYRRNMLFINFWLGNVLFPTETMIFPKKLMASSWNLTDSRKSNFRCGFSGTDDACTLLPHPLMYQPPNEPSLRATNGKMIAQLIEKATFCSLPESGDQIVDVLADLASKKNVHALIDAGALLAHHPIEKVADVFLNKLCSQERFKGVVYYSVSKCSWRVKDIKHRETSLRTSPISESDAFVIYDQSRCRGADMRLRQNAKAFLSIGPCQRKDSLMQAAGRLRQLDFGQTIIAIATPDVEIMIRDCVGLNSHENVSMEHVLGYVLFNSVNAIGSALKHWSSQGLRFLHFLHDPSHVRGEEKCDLETLYAASDKPQTVSEGLLPKLKVIQSDYGNSCENSNAIMNIIWERTQTLGLDVMSNYAVCFDECERELEQEREMENEKEKELPKMHPFKEDDWDYSKIFTVDSPRKLNDAARPITVADFAKDFLSKRAIAMCSSIFWGDAKIFLTSNFTRPLKENPPYDDYLRPVRLLLYFPKQKEFLVLSEREADKIWRCYLERSFTKQSGGPILCGMNFLSSDKVGSSVLDNMVSSPGDIPAVSHSALTLFNGQTAFRQEDQEALKNSLLLSREVVSGASFFCNRRGFRVMFHESDLERTCNQVLQNLHARECGYSF